MHTTGIALLLVMILAVFVIHRQNNKIEKLQREINLKALRLSSLRDSLCEKNAEIDRLRNG